VLLELGEKVDAFGEKLVVKAAYRTLVRYSGVQSHNAIRKGLVELNEVGFMVLPPATVRRSPDRRTATYFVTPNSDILVELAHSVAHKMQEIEAEIELRRRQRKERLQLRRGSQIERRPHCTKYKHLYSRNTVVQ